MLFNSRFVLTKFGWPSGVPNTFIPCCCVGNSDPRQTTALGSYVSATICKTLHPEGFTTAEFQIFVLPGLWRMPSKKHPAMWRTLSWFSREMRQDTCRPRNQWSLVLLKFVLHQLPREYHGVTLRSLLPLVDCVGDSTRSSSHNMLTKRQR